MWFGMDVCKTLILARYADSSSYIPVTTSCWRKTTEDASIIHVMIPWCPTWHPHKYVVSVPFRPWWRWLIFVGSLYINELHKRKIYNFQPIWWLCTIASNQFTALSVNNISIGLHIYDISVISATWLYTLVRAQALHQPRHTRHSLHSVSGAGCVMYTLEGTKSTRKPWTWVRNSQRTP